MSIFPYLVALVSQVTATKPPPSPPPFAPPFAQFMVGPEQRARYWARSFAGWHRFSGVQPNAAHEALARLQRAGWLGPLITQNVDQLHHKAGSSHVLELHGTTHR